MTYDVRIKYPERQATSDTSELVIRFFEEAHRRAFLEALKSGSYVLETNHVEETWATA